MATMREIVFDCERAPALARFRAAVLDGYAIRARTTEGNEFCVVEQR